MELKEELDAFVNAALAEYAKLFLEPGAEVRTSIGDRSMDSFCFSTIRNCWPACGVSRCRTLSCTQMR